MTTNFGFGQPEEGSQGWDITFKDNFTRLETELHAIRTNQRATQVNIEGLVRDKKPIGYNMGFHYWQRGTSFSAAGFGPDMWKIAINSGSLSTVTRQDGSTSFNNDYVARADPATNGVIELYNIIPYTTSNLYKAYIDKSLTFAVDVKKEDADSKVRAFIRDGVGTTYSSNAPTNTSKNRIVVTRTISTSATKLEVGIEVDDTPAGAQTGYYVDIGNAALAVGVYSDVEYIPINAQDDYYGCALVYQTMDFDVGWYGLQADVVMKTSLFFPCPMAGTPTATVTKGTENKGTLSSIEFTPVNNLGGWVKAVGATKTGRLLKVTGNALKLEVS